MPKKRYRSIQKVVMNFAEKCLDKRAKRWYNMQAVHGSKRALGKRTLRGSESGEKVFEKTFKKYLTSGGKGGIIIESLRRGEDGLIIDN